MVLSNLDVITYTAHSSIQLKCWLGAWALNQYLRQDTVHTKWTMTTSKLIVKVVIVLCFSLPNAILGGQLNDICQRSRDCSGLNQICKYGRCQCAEDTFLWHGKTCLKAGIGYGDICSDQSECSYSGDPHLHCTETDTGHRCLCRNGFQRVGSKVGKCNRVSHVKLNKMDPKTTEVRSLSDHGSTKYMKF